MPLKKGLGWNSDEISVLVGFDGTEPPETLRWYSRYHGTFPCRIACAINQYYPEMPSGYYLNKAMLALVQEALEETGLHVVIEDNFRQDGVVPEELPGSLAENDDYLLVDQDMTLCGRMYVWESRGGKGHFYHDNFIIEIVGDAKRTGDILAGIEEQCKDRGVTFFRINGDKS